jgi:acyl-CoA synthetase (AMP-forming)/AMP-acid ligase II
VRFSDLGPGDWVSLHSRYKPDARCLVRGDGSLRTFAQVNSRVNRLARALEARGLAKGDRIAIMATDSIDYVELMLASMKIGTTIVALNFRLSAPELANLLSLSRPTALFISARYAETTASGREALGPALRVCVSFDESDVADISYEALIETQGDDSDFPSRSRDEDILSLSLTSGTTSTPKGVLQSQRMMKAVTTSGVVELGLQPDDLIYSGPPLFHVAGLGHILYALSRGAATLVLPQFSAPTVLSWMQSGQLQHCLLVPSMVLALMSDPRVKESDYAGLRSIMYGGAPMAPTAIRDMVETFGCDFYNGFGAGTEAGGQIMFRPADHRRALEGNEYLFGSIGKPQYGCDIRLVGADGNDVAMGEIGEIYSRSDAIMSGYLGQPELTARCFRGEWFHAGDLARIDKDGYYFLAGRADDMIIRGGENVYPVEIEDIVGDHPDVVEIAVVGESSEYWGQTVTAVVRLRPGSALSAENLRDHCRGRLATYKIPERIVFVADFPRNATGKIQKSAVQDSLASGLIS